MELTEKIAYIKGLAEGLSLDETKPEVRVINAIIDLLDDIAYDVQDIEELYDDLSGQVDEIDQDLAEVEDELYGDGTYDDDDFDDFDDFGDIDDEFYDDDDDVFYEVTCDSCGKKINVSEDVLLEGEIACPNCGATLEFDFSGIFEEDDDDEDCDSDCGSCSIATVCEQAGEQAKEQAEDTTEKE